MASWAVSNSGSNRLRPVSPSLTLRRSTITPASMSNSAAAAGVEVAGGVQGVAWRRHDAQPCPALPWTYFSVAPTCSPDTRRVKEVDAHMRGGEALQGRRGDDVLPSVSRADHPWRSRRRAGRRLPRPARCRAPPGCCRCPAKPVSGRPGAADRGVPSNCPRATSATAENTDPVTSPAGFQYVAEASSATATKAPPIPSARIPTASTPWPAASAGNSARAPPSRSRPDQGHHASVAVQRRSDAFRAGVRFRTSATWVAYYTRDEEDLGRGATSSGASGSSHRSSMTQDTSLDAAQPLSFVQRVIGVVVSPGETMARIAAAPRWFDVLALTTVLMAAGFAVFFSSDVGKAAYVDQAVASIESFGGTVNDRRCTRCCSARPASRRGSQARRSCSCAADGGGDCRHPVRRLHGAGR